MITTASVDHRVMNIPKIQMVDVKSQYEKIKERIDARIQEVINSSVFINGPHVKSFKEAFQQYLDVKYVIPCGNGTDALQIALMALDLEPGDEVIMPAFTYFATAEVVALLGLTPVMIDVDPDTFNIEAATVAKAITEKTKVVIPVNLYGQCAPLAEIRKLADEKGVYMIEDNAQATGAEYIYSKTKRKKAGTVGHIGCTSFYPSKNLGAYGDGGAIFTDDPILAQKLVMVANHGQSQKYVHDEIGCNSRLDAIQAVILEEKLNHLDTYNSSRQEVADRYDLAFINNDHLVTPQRASYSTHVFHQYTLRIKDGQRDELKDFLKSKDIPTMIYYPIPLYKQKAFRKYNIDGMKLDVTEQLCSEVLSLPIHTEMTKEEIDYITQTVNSFFDA